MICLFPVFSSLCTLELQPGLLPLIYVILFLLLQILSFFYFFQIELTPSHCKTYLRDSGIGLWLVSDFHLIKIGPSIQLVCKVKIQWLLLSMHHLACLYDGPCHFWFKPILPWLWGRANLVLEPSQMCSLLVFLSYISLYPLPLWNNFLVSQPEVTRPSSDIL